MAPDALVQIQSARRQWTENQLGLLPPALASAVLRLCLTIGDVRAIALLQQSINDLASRRVQWLRITGTMGPATIEFARGLDTAELLATLAARAQAIRSADGKSTKTARARGPKPLAA